MALAVRVHEPLMLPKGLWVGWATKQLETGVNIWH